MEVDLCDAGGLRVMLQRQAREQLSAEGAPIARATVTRRAHALLAARGIDTSRGHSVLSERAARALNRGTTSGVIGLAIAGFTMSYDALHSLAVTQGVPPALAWMWPLVVDGFIVIASLSVVRAVADSQSRRLSVAVGADVFHHLGDVQRRPRRTNSGREVRRRDPTHGTGAVVRTSDATTTPTTQNQPRAASTRHRPAVRRQPRAGGTATEHTARGSRRRPAEHARQSPTHPRRPTTSRHQTHRKNTRRASRHLRRLRTTTPPRD